MTIDEFLVELGKTKHHKWFLTGDNKIRCELSNSKPSPLFCCPITSVIYEKTGGYVGVSAAIPLSITLIALNAEAAMKIFRAADNVGERDLRPKLLEILNL